MGADDPTPPESPAQALARPKSSTLTLPVGRELDVGRLQVAMDDALAVRFLERLGDLLAISSDLVDGDRPSREAFLQVFAFDELEREERLAAGLLEP